MHPTESDSLSNPANPPRPLATLEQSLNYAAELLCCAAATAYESGDRLSGTDRQLAFAVVHLVELAKTVIDRSLSGIEISA
ncbi:DUF3077 domain-containing protein [Pseudomonas alliivorans]|uniref:DUF3077 domain-containing protein n=1 Tax=Pseudomonas alliivorans TaxID=2810613 RepID=A0ABS4C1H6_9PSED|nr:MULTISPECIES: DUF3077 domain-containing protein [Pseudomonas]MBP0940840.1 DUF3077 domain-containing protein [Pseudomonas alliivorans]MBP0944465.1 DUF3077 domain-containing protein [Pseudomonas alliivorans]MEE4307204.1 DUF3077 domain-containing protein [Pseudomonas alliivorans]MEE4325243.1 DUF3077 domain-containing protein [Pseudomonas alliivorans]MEE4332556.1 DUF3077 domain-containing protein [Pseudomonas alliivorans]